LSVFIFEYLKLFEILAPLFLPKFCPNIWNSCTALLHSIMEQCTLLGW